MTQKKKYVSTPVLRPSTPKIPSIGFISEFKNATTDQRKNAPKIKATS